MKPIAAIAINSTPVRGCAGVRRLDVYLGQLDGLSSFAPSVVPTAMFKQNYEDCTPPGGGDA
ncbi:hypothetical protein ACEN8I_00250 [Polaromonas sp. CT11-55]|uniref:hypothetical protein n=1 Tax=Polaromonas sp. CT11-55 TaxID=3243045 RepID=UPI0039A66A48